MLQKVRHIFYDNFYDRKDRFTIIPYKLWKCLALSSETLRKITDFKLQIPVGNKHKINSKSY